MSHQAVGGSDQRAWSPTPTPRSSRQPQASPHSRTGSRPSPSCARPPSPAAGTGRGSAHTPGPVRSSAGGAVPRHREDPRRAGCCRPPAAETEGMGLRRHRDQHARRRRLVPGHRWRRRRLDPALELRCPRPDLLGPSPTRTPTPGQPHRNRSAGPRRSLMICSPGDRGIVPSSVRTKIDVRWTRSVYPLSARRLACRVSRSVAPIGHAIGHCRSAWLDTEEHRPAQMHTGLAEVASCSAQRCQ